jgi:hypothetical protein
MEEGVKGGDGKSPPFFSLIFPLPAPTEGEELCSDSVGREWGAGDGVTDKGIISYMFIGSKDRFL